MHMPMNLRITIIAIIALSLACCTNNRDPRLDRAADLAVHHPNSALAMLDSITPASLSTADRHYRDLLTIRASDKAYITHTSDSLILDVINYYASHRTAPDRYPMALYYGGRVYADLGNYPTAMEYFQKALDLLPPDTDDLSLRCNVLSQYGRMLFFLRLYDDAITQVKSAIEIEKTRHDTTNWIYDLQLLTSIYTRAEKYALAEQPLKEALELSKNKPNHHRAKSLIQLANIKHKVGQLDSALSLIKGIPDKVEPIERNSTLGSAAIIYFKAGILDTALTYSQEIINGHDSSPKAVAYQLLLSEQLIDQLPKDSLCKYIWDYRALLEGYFDQNKTTYALNQQNKYNYKLHERDKEKAEHSNVILKYYIALSLLALAIITIISLYLNTKRKAEIISLHEALDNIKALESQLTSPGQNRQTDPSTEKDLASTSSFKDKETELRERLKDKLMQLYHEADKTTAISTSILKSEAYKNLQKHINNNEMIKDDAQLWDELERTVLSVSPNFKENLELLTMGRLTMPELHTALLIKCGIKPSQMTTLLGRTNGALISRRQILCKKAFDQKMGTKVIDSIIRLL